MGGYVGTGGIFGQIKSLEKVCRPIGGLFTSTVSTPGLYISLPGGKIFLFWIFPAFLIQLFLVLTANKVMTSYRITMKTCIEYMFTIYMHNHKKRGDFNPQYLC